MFIKDNRFLFSPFSTKCKTKVGNNYGMVFYIVIGIISILIILANALLFMLQSEIIHSDYAYRGDVITHLAEAAVEEAAMAVREQMNRQSGSQDFYELLRAGVGSPSDWDNSPDIPIPETLALAKEYFRLKPENIKCKVTYTYRHPFDVDMLGNKRPYTPQSPDESYGSLLIRVEVSFPFDGGKKKYTKQLVVMKDVKVVRVTPPMPEFTLLVRRGGWTNANYNLWDSDQGGQKLTFTCLNGLDADPRKCGKILFGGGMPEAGQTQSGATGERSSGTLSAYQLLGFAPMPDPNRKFNDDKPIIINATGDGRLNGYGVEDQRPAFLSMDNVQSNPATKGMTPAYDFLALGEFNQQENKFYPLWDVYKGAIKQPLPVTDASGQLKEGKTELISSIRGYGLENSYFYKDMMGEGARGYKHYFENYIKKYGDFSVNGYRDPAGMTKYDGKTYLNGTGSGVDLFGVDYRGWNKLEPQRTLVYGNVYMSYFQIGAIHDGSDYAAVKWVELPPFSNGDDSSSIALLPTHLPKEKKTTLGDRIKGAWKKLTGGDQPPAGIIDFGRNGENAEMIPLPEELKMIVYNQALNAPVLNYRLAMSRPIYKPYNQDGMIRTEYTYASGLKEPVQYIAEQFPLDLCPDMAAYRFVGPLEFERHLMFMDRLWQDEQQFWHLSLDGIWFVEGLVSEPSNPRYQQLTLPPDLRIKGKGLIATIHGTNIQIDGIFEEGADEDTQLTLMCAPSKVLMKLRELPEEFRIGTSINGDIIVSDHYIQASLCAPMGRLYFQDDPGWTQSHANQLRKGLMADRFNIFGNLIVDVLDLHCLENYWQGETIGGGILEYDPKMIPANTGQTGLAAFHVNLGQRFSYYHITVMHDDPEADEGPQENNSNS